MSSIKYIPPIRLTQPAWVLIQNYFKTHPTERLEETRTHYIDPLYNPDAFFESELGEPIHHSLLELIRQNRSVLDHGHALRWTVEEGEEIKARSVR